MNLNDKCKNTEVKFLDIVLNEVILKLDTTSHNNTASDNNISSDFCFKLFDNIIFEAQGVHNYNDPDIIKYSTIVLNNIEDEFWDYELNKFNSNVMLY